MLLTDLMEFRSVRTYKIGRGVLLNDLTDSELLQGRHQSQKRSFISSAQFLHQVRVSQALQGTRVMFPSSPPQHKSATAIVAVEEFRKPGACSCEA